MFKFAIILVLNLICSGVIAYLNSNSVSDAGEGEAQTLAFNRKAFLSYALFYFLYLNLVFAVSYEYTKYVRKEIFTIPVWIVWCAGLAGAGILFARTKLYDPLTAAKADRITDHIAFVFIETVLVSTQKRDYQYISFITASVVTLLIMLGIILSHRYSLRTRTRNIRWTDLPVLMALVVIYEYLNSVIYQSENTIYTLFIEFGILLFILFLTLDLNLTIIIYSAADMIWILIHYFVKDFRGSPFIPTDIMASGTALDVLSEYSLYTNKSIWNLIFAVMVVILICVYGARVKWTGKYGSIIRIAGAGVTLLLGILWFNSDFISDNNLYWELFGVGTIQNTYDRVGPTLGFIEVMKEIRVARPEGYSQGAVKDLAKNYAYDPKTGTDIKPDIIVIMNETFADIGDLGGLETDGVDYMPFYHSLVSDDSRIATGRTLVSTFGGSTSKSEYEFLTGSSMQLTPNLNPYLTDIQTDIYSIVTTLEDQGYYTIATHPCSATNWNRNKVYPHMGFDEIMFSDAYDNPDMIRGWISDKDVYDKIDGMINANDTDAPLFIFGVTVQNHGGYDPDELSDERLKYRLPEAEPSDLDVFLSLMEISDSALEEMIHRVDSYDRPTVLLFFGDHYPRLGDESFEAITDPSLFSGDLQLEQTEYMTPYLVYANYDIDTSVFNELTSLNYLGTDLLKSCGLNMTPYNSYLYEMQRILPAMNAYAYVNADGAHCSYEDMNEDESNALKDYSILEYDSLYGSMEKSAFTIHE